MMPSLKRLKKDDQHKREALSRAQEEEERIPLYDRCAAMKSTFDLYENLMILRSSQHSPTDHTRTHANMKCYPSFAWEPSDSTKKQDKNHQHHEQQEQDDDLTMIFLVQNKEAPTKQKSKNESLLQYSRGPYCGDGSTSSSTTIKYTQERRVLALKKRKSPFSSHQEVVPEDPLTTPTRGGITSGRSTTDRSRSSAKRRKEERQQATNRSFFEQPSLCTKILPEADNFTCSSHVSSTTRYDSKDNENDSIRIFNPKKKPRKQPQAPEQQKFHSNNHRSIKNTTTKNKELTPSSTTTRERRRPSHHKHDNKKDNTSALPSK